MYEFLRKANPHLWIQVIGMLPNGHYLNDLKTKASLCPNRYPLKLPPDYAKNWVADYWHDCGYDAAEDANDDVGSWNAADGD